MDRRQFLQRSSGALLASSLPLPARGSVVGAFVDAIRTSAGTIVPVDPADPAVVDVELSRRWKGDLCSWTVRNGSKRAVRIKEIVFASVPDILPGATVLYGESFQMLSQTGGSLEKPVDLGYSESRHYKIPQPEGAASMAGLLALTPPGENTFLLAFTSCRRFIGRFYALNGGLHMVMDTEGLELAPGASWDLEELQFTRGPYLSDLLPRLADRISHHHSHRTFRPVPTGWCSWYYFGPRVTAQNVLDNLDFIAKNISGLKYIQIDDGYQPAMGDWLETGKSFGGDVAAVLKETRKRGFEPAIWVAPFIAEEKSHVFQRHPEWFIKDADGSPLAAGKVTFAGWHNAPWYALDGTHPEVQKHFEELFQVMRRDWGCAYFKLDACFWGAMHGGRFHDPQATRIEAYRRGMGAIRRGAGDAFILGCNHPMWPSFGLIDGSRSSDDIKRKWETFRKAGQQTLCRNWQNERLWWNDPDAVLLTGNLSDDEFQFHATLIYACGGMVLSGDDLTQISPKRLAMLRKLILPTGIAAEFRDATFRVGLMKLAAALMACLLNWDDVPQTLSFELPESSRVTDYWSGEDLGMHAGTYTLKDLPPHSVRLLSGRECTKLGVCSYAFEMG